MKREIKNHPVDGWFLISVFYLKLRIPKAIDDGVNFFFVLAVRAFLLTEGLVIRQILRPEDMMHRLAVNLFRHAEDGGDSLDNAAVIADAFEASGDGASGGGGSQQKKDIFTPYHRLQVVPEDHLAVTVKLRCDNI